MSTKIHNGYRIERLHGDRIGEDKSGDRGPYRERHAFPPCPRCDDNQSVGQDPCMARLECGDCGHTWRPRGIYLPARRAARKPAKRGGGGRG